MLFFRTAVISCLLLLLSCYARAQYTYTSTDSNNFKACFKGYCDTDTIRLSSLKKTRSLPMITDAEALQVVEFTIMLTDVNEMVYIAVIKFSYLDRNNIELLARSYKTMQITDILAKNKEGRLVKLKSKLYHIINDLK